jgi:RNA polymerase sigma factor (sigma-70 family)
MFGLNADNKIRLSDRELVERYRYSFDTAYIGILFQRYAHLLFGVCMKYLGNEERAKDAVMEVFEKVISELRRHDVEEFKPWIYTVTRNHCLMGLRSEKVTNERHSNYTHYLRAIVESDEPLHLNGQRIEAEDRALNQAIDTLNDGQRQCVRLFYFEQMSYEEIAASTGFSLKQVKSHLQNGKRNLKLKLTEGDV